MYKVFFNDRTLYLTDNFEKHFQVKYGLFYKYDSRDGLQELITFYQKLKLIKSLYVFHSDIEELRDSFRTCFIPVPAAGGLISNEKGEFLMIYRRGKWDLPKGKISKKETTEETAIREVEEECGITGVEIVKPLLSTYHTYPFKNGTALKKTTWFEMLYRGSEPPVPETEEDIEEIIWVKKEDLAPYLEKSFPAIRDVFKYFG
ncbi:MAG: NUDIX domain-containing protein [Bacteroidales bacterium]|nr:NUDIX domain-containing protein [Bacteroidales bacterium]